MSTYKLVNIDIVHPDPNQPRRIFPDDSGLVKSLKVEGMINPVEVDEGFVIITGERRFRAAKKAQFRQIPIIINYSHYTPYERLRRQMAENLQRSGNLSEMMNPVDIAEGFARLISYRLGRKFKIGEDPTYVLNKEIAENLGVSQQTIISHLKLLEKPQFILDDIRKGRPWTYYRNIMSLPQESRELLERRIAAGDYNTREELINEAQIIRLNPKLGALMLARTQIKDSAAINRILTSATSVGLALEPIDLDSFPPQERELIKAELSWLRDKINEQLKS